MKQFLLIVLMVICSGYAQASSAKKSDKKRNPQNTEYSNTSIGSGNVNSRCDHLDLATIEMTQCQIDLIKDQAKEINSLTDKLVKKYGPSMEQLIRETNKNWKNYVGSQCDYEMEVGGSGSELEGHTKRSCEIAENSKRLDFLKKEVNK